MTGQHLLDGAYDLHVHAGPDFFPRSIDVTALGGLALSHNMAGVVVKYHGGSSVQQVRTANAILGKEILIPSLTLNTFVGGYNPDAVHLAAGMGAKILYFPTITAKNHVAHYGSSGYSSMQHGLALSAGKPLYALDEEENLRPEVFQVLEAARDFNMAVATSHLSLKEVRILLKVALEMRLPRLILTHPDSPLLRMSNREQSRWAGLGVWIEKAALWVLPEWHGNTLSEYVTSIRLIGPEHCLLSSDYGSIAAPQPVTGFSLFLQELLANGMEYNALKRMVQENPARLLA